MLAFISTLVFYILWDEFLHRAKNSKNFCERVEIRGPKLHRVKSEGFSR